MYNNEKSIAQQAELMDQWKKYGLNNPHLFIVKNTPGNDDCIRFLQQLTKVGLSSSNIRRSVKRAFFYQRLSNNCSDYEINRLLESTELVCDIYNDFIGVFVIDISDFISDSTNERLEVLLDYACEHEADIRFCFIVQTNTSNQEHALYSCLSRRLVINKLNFAAYSIEQLMEYVEEKNKANKINIDQLAAENLETMFIEILESKTVESITEMFRFYDKFLFDYRDSPFPISKDQIQQTFNGYITESEITSVKREFGF